MAKQRMLQSGFDEMLSDINRYVVETVIQQEKRDKDTKQYSSHLVASILF